MIAQNPNRQQHQDFQMEQENIPIMKSDLMRSDHEQDIEMPVLSASNNIISTHKKSSPKFVCSFFTKENNTLEFEERSRSATKLSGLIVFYLMVIAIEIVGGFKANSLAVITDAAHLFTDVIGFSLALFTVWASGWEATVQYSFGFARLEVLGALLSVLLIWQMSILLIKEAVERLFETNALVNGKLMFAIALFGFIVNFVMVTWLGHGHGHGHGHSHHACEHNDHHHHHHHQEEEGVGVQTEEDTTILVSSPSTKTEIFNINIQGAYLHVMADLIQSAGVMVAGGVLWWKPNWLVVDLICTIVFSTFALITTIPMLRHIYGILMERTPPEIDISTLQNDLKCIRGIQEIRDLHIWTITVGQIVLCCHILADGGVSSSEIITKIRDCCKQKHHIYHVTVQVE